MRRTLALVALLTAVHVVTPATQAPTRLVLTNPQLVDLAGRRLQRVSVLVIADGRIVDVKTSGGVEPAADVTAIDASGLVLVPGLVDVSLSLAPSLRLDAAYVQVQALRWGVTTGRVIDVPLAWAASMGVRVERGEVLSPRLIIAAPRLNGPPPGAATSRRALTASRDQAAYGVAAATRLVSGAARGKARWVRIGPWTSPDVVTAIVAAAQKAALRVSIEPGLVGPGDAARSGIALIEGLGLIDAGPPEAVDGARPVREEGTTWFNWDRATAAVVTALAARVARARVMVAPMLRIVAPTGGQSGEAWAREENEALPRALRAQATFARDRFARSAGGAAAWTRRQQFVREFAARGGQLAVATGAGAEGWPVPGLAFHQELEALVGAGVDPADVLVAATRHGAAVLEQAEAGWQKGMPADFIAIKGNPLADIRALRSPAFVMRRGERLDPGILAREAARLASGGR